MLKRTFILALLLCSLSVPAFAANWYYVGPYEGQYNVYIDNSRVQKIDDFADIWIKMANSDGQYVMSEVMLRKSTHEAAVVKNIFYDANDKVVKTVDYGNKAKIEKITPNSLEAKIYDLVW